MKANITIPTDVRTQQIIEFRINPTTLQIVAVINKKEGPMKQVVDVSVPWANATDTQKTIIKGFFKELGRLALEQANEGVTLLATDIEGELFEVPAPPTEPI